MLAMMLRMKTGFLLAVMLFTMVLSRAQGKGIRYRDSIFSEITVTENLSYNTAAIESTKIKYHLFDFYQPAADTATHQLRPLIIWMHGGGFTFGSKNTKEVELWCNGFAQHGFVCAAINYQLSGASTLFKFTALVKGAAAGVENVRTAIVYFKTHAKEYRIDTNRIILAGNSAGGVLALQTAYSRPAELATLAKDSSLNKPTINTGKIAAVVNFWGALFDVSWLKKHSIPIISVHGSNDHTVPAGRKGASFFGSIPIHEEADKLHIPNKLKIYDGYAHELEKHFNPIFTNAGAKSRRKEAADFAAESLYEMLYKK